MNAKNRFIHYFFTLVSVYALVACSDSDVPEPTPIELIEKVSFPFTTNNTLYAFDPQTGEKEKLAESNKSMMILLDTDQSTQVNDENNNVFFDHTPLPEYAAYVIDQSVRLYDFYTRREHILTNFEALNDLETNEYVCDLRNLTTVDEARLAKKEAFFKDEKAFYIKTSLNEDCTGSATSFNYLRIEIADSFTETFDIRRTTLLEHTHKHTHKHVHVDSHDHPHGDGLCEKDEITKIETCSTNHLHNHVHEHDFLYVIMDEHLLGEDPDIVHNDPSNQEIELETLPVLVGRRHQVDEALMYSGYPIVDTNNKQFGYLGFNRTESEYKFYVIINQDLEKLELWNTTESEFSSELSIQPENAAGKVLQVSADTVLIEFNWKLVKWDLESLFDDDMDKEREYNVNNPVFQRTPEENYLSASYNIDSQTETIVIKDNNSLHVTFKDTPSRHVRTFEDTNLSDFSFSLFSDNQIVAIKTFEEDDSFLGTSITKIDIDNALEQTIIPITQTHIIYSTFFYDVLITSIEDRINTTWNGNFFGPQLTEKFSPALENVTWAAKSDLRPTSNNTLFEPAILHSDVSISSSITSNPALFEPQAYFFDTNAVDGDGQGDLIGTIPTEVSIAHTIIIHNELFGNITIEEAITSPRVLKTYFFNPDDSSVEMKLMYEEVLEQ